MSSDQFMLGPVPSDQRELELWLQHAMGFILFEDVRGYAISKIDSKLDAPARDAAIRAVNVRIDDGARRCDRIVG